MRCAAFSVYAQPGCPMSVGRPGGRASGQGSNAFPYLETSFRQWQSSGPISRVPLSHPDDSSHASRYLRMSNIQTPARGKVPRPLSSAPRTLCGRTTVKRSRISRHRLRLPLPPKSPLSAIFPPFNSNANCSKRRLDVDGVNEHGAMGFRLGNSSAAR